MTPQTSRADIVHLDAVTTSILQLVDVFGQGLKQSLVADHGTATELRVVRRRLLLLLPSQLRCCFSVASHNPNWPQ